MRLIFVAVVGFMMRTCAALDLPQPIPKPGTPCLRELTSVRYVDEFGKDLRVCRCRSSCTWEK